MAALARARDSRGRRGSGRTGPAGGPGGFTPSIGAIGQQEDAASFFQVCPRSFDRAVIVARWYDLRLERRETQVRKWSRDYPIDLSLPKKLSTSANGQKEFLLLSALF